MVVSDHLLTTSHFGSSSQGGSEQGRRTRLTADLTNDDPHAVGPYFIPRTDLPRPHYQYSRALTVSKTCQTPTPTKAKAIRYVNATRFQQSTLLAH
jgi:hypothetical protein